MHLKEKWDLLVEGFPEKTITDQHYEKLIKAYSGKKRYYHNLSHLSELYRLFEMCRSSIQAPDVFQFTIWYHDVVYKILQAKNNEKRSARQARLQLQKLQWDEEKIRQVEALILDTRLHRIEASAGLPDAPWFLDMDLAILGSTPEQYNIYRQQIRKEYWIIPESLFKKGRIKALSHLLKRRRIYQTNVFLNNLEFQARENLQRELAVLK